MKKAKIAISNPLLDTKIAQDKEDGAQLGVRQTPTFFVDGKMLFDLGEVPLRKAIAEALKNEN